MHSNTVSSLSKLSGSEAVNLIILEVQNIIHFLQISCTYATFLQEFYMWKITVLQLCIHFNKSKWFSTFIQKNRERLTSKMKFCLIYFSLFIYLFLKQAAVTVVHSFIPFSMPVLLDCICARVQNNFPIGETVCGQNLSSLYSRWSLLEELRRIGSKFKNKKSHYSYFSRRMWAFGN